MNTKLKSKKRIKQWNKFVEFMSVHRTIEFIGNGEGTKDIENSLNRLIDVINELGVKDRSHWALGLKGVKHEMKAHANEILNCAKSFAYYLDNYGKE